MLMAAADYLNTILNRENINYREDSLVLSSVRDNLIPSIQAWAGNLLNDVYFSGSFAKGTANKSNTDMDLFISLSNGSVANYYKGRTYLGNTYFFKFWTQLSC